MRKEARGRRDDERAIAEGWELSDDFQTLTYHEFADGVCVLYSPIFGYAYANQNTTGVGDSLLIESGRAGSPGHAAAQWRQAQG